MSDLAKSLLNMEKDAAELVVKSQSFQGAQSAVTASIAKADGDAATANGDLSDGAEKSNKKVSEVEGSFQKSEGVKAAEIAEDDSKKGDKDADKKTKDSDDTSLEKSIQSTEEGKNAFVVSPFLAEMTKQLSKSLESVQVAVNGANGTSEQVIDVFAKSFGAIARSQQSVIEQNAKLADLVKSMTEKLDTMSGKLEEIEGQPTIRKSVRDISVHNKDFNKSIVGEQQALSKSEKISIMNDLFVKGDTVQPMDILNIESGAQLRPEVENRIAQIVAARQ